MRPLNLFNTPYSVTSINLQNLTWDFKSGCSTDGVVPKAVSDGSFYKLSSFNPSVGFYGNEAVTECVVSDLLTSMGIPHIEYRLVMGDIIYDGKQFKTPVCISKNFNPSGKPVISLERFLRTQCPGVPALDACIQLGFSSYVYTMFVVDFLILNRDRHGSNVEVIDGNLVPLFDHGLSLMALQDPIKWNHWSGDMVNNFVGSPSLRANLYSIPRDCWPRIGDPDLKILSRFKNFWDTDKIDCARRMLAERWEHIVQRGEGIL